MKNKDILAAAKILFDRRLEYKGLDSMPLDLMPSSIEESYLIQNELKILYLTLHKNYTIGKKVGCTNKFAQQQLNIFEPFYGNLFAKYSDANGCELKSSKFFRPFVEPEISFRITNDININDAPYKFEDAYILFDALFPSIEIVDFRFGENIKEVGIKNLIMTNGASEFYIMGSEMFKLKDIDLSNLDVSLIINDSVIDQGNTNLVLGNPINSAIWLINKLSSLGEPMLKGQIITTGTCTKAISIKKESKIKAKFTGLGDVEFQYI